MEEDNKQSSSDMSKFMFSRSIVDTDLLTYSSLKDILDYINSKDVVLDNVKVLIKRANKELRKDNKRLFVRRANDRDKKAENRICIIRG